MIRTVRFLCCVCLVELKPPEEHDIDERINGEVLVSHGYCPICLEKALKELED